MPLVPLLLHATAIIVVLVLLVPVLGQSLQVFDDSIQTLRPEPYDHDHKASIHCHPEEKGDLSNQIPEPHTSGKERRDDDANGDEERLWVGVCEKVIVEALKSKVGGVCKRFGSRKNVVEEAVEGQNVGYANCQFLSSI